MPRPRLILTLATFAFLTLVPTTCATLTPIAVGVSAGIIDCGVKEVTELAVNLIDDVNTCLAVGKQDGCNAAAPADPTKTSCSWKSCLWDLAKKQGKAHASDALICAVDQAGSDFAAAYTSTGDNSLASSSARAEEFVTESGAKLKHRIEPGAARPPIRKK